MTTSIDGRDYEVGYGKPPVHTRFQKGQSGNPQRRKKNGAQYDLNALILKEACRTVSVKEGGDTVRMPLIEVIVRATFQRAAKGSASAQRMIFEALRPIQEEKAATLKAENDNRAKEEQEAEAERVLLEFMESQKKRREANLRVVPS